MKRVVLHVVLHGERDKKNHDYYKGHIKTHPWVKSTTKHARHIAKTSSLEERAYILSIEQQIFYLRRWVGPTT